MKKKNIAIVVVIVGLIAIVNAYQRQPERLTGDHLEEMRLAAEREHRARVAEQEEREAIAAEQLAEENESTPPTEPAEELEVSESYQVAFETTAGDFVIEVYPDWAPIGAERFRELVEAEFFDEARFFRVVPGFVVQFGLAADPDVTAEWRDKNLQDEPVGASNEAGTITFAQSSAPNSRTTQLFINLGDNPRLDQMRFAPFGRVVEGMDAVQAINPEYGERPHQGFIQARGNDYLEREFPNLDYIKTARIVEDHDEEDGEQADEPEA